jgi:hypothetical protein
MTSKKEQAALAESLESNGPVVQAITQTGNKGTSKNAVIKWGTDIIACLTAINLAGTGTEVTAVCSTDGVGNAATHKEVGDSNWSPSMTLLVDKDDVSLLTALMIGQSQALTCYPFADEVGLVSYAWTDAKVLNHGLTGGVTDYGTLDIQFSPTGDPTIELVPV